MRAILERDCERLRQYLSALETQKQSLEQEFAMRQKQLADQIEVIAKDLKERETALSE